MNSIPTIATATATGLDPRALRRYLRKQGLRAPYTEEQVTEALAHFNLQLAGLIPDLPPIETISQVRARKEFEPIPAEVIAARRDRAARLEAAMKRAGVWLNHTPELEA